MMTKPFLAAKLLLAITVTASAFIASSGSAATVTYWRFENSAGFLADSSGNNHTLTNNTTVTQENSPFSDPIPQTGASNDHAASFSGSHYLSAADSNEFSSNTFSIEAFIQRPTSAFPTGSAIIAGHFGSGGSFEDQRSWFLGVSNGVLRLALGTTTGTGTRNYDAFTLSIDTNYFVAATVDVTSSGTDAITLYLQDLSTGILQTQNFSRNPDNTSIFNAAAPFTIGATAQGSANFFGLIDEVRFSNTKLSEADLLVVPEPSALVLIGAVGLLTLVRGRRRTRTRG